MFPVQGYPKDCGSASIECCNFNKRKKDYLTKTKSTNKHSVKVKWIKRESFLCLRPSWPEIRNLQAAGQQEERHYRDLQFSSRHSHAHCCSLQWCSYPDLGNSEKQLQLRLNWNLVKFPMAHGGKIPEALSGLSMTRSGASISSHKLWNPPKTLKCVAFAPNRSCSKGDEKSETRFRPFVT